MKKILLAVSAMTLLMAGMAFAEAEVPVAVRRRSSGEHERVGRGPFENCAHLREVVGNEIDGSRSEARTGDVRQEVRHVT